MLIKHCMGVVIQLLRQWQIINLLHSTLVLYFCVSALVCERFIKMKSRFKFSKTLVSTLLLIIRKLRLGNLQYRI